MQQPNQASRSDWVIVHKGRSDPGCLVSAQVAQSAAQRDTVAVRNSRHTAIARSSAYDALRIFRPPLKKIILTVFYTVPVASILEDKPNRRAVGDHLRSPVMQKSSVTTIL